MSIARLDDAKALRAMGIPLNTPVEDRELSPQAEKKIAKVFKATRAFGDAVRPWAENQTGKRYAAVNRAWDNLARALENADLPDDTETVAVALFVEPCHRVWSQWDGILTALENGEPVTITGDNAPWPLGPFSAEGLTSAQ